MSDNKNKQGSPIGNRSGGPAARMMPGEKAKDFKGSVKKLWDRLKKQWFALLVVTLFAIGGTIFSIVGPTILGKATTEIFRGLLASIEGTGNIDFSVILNIIYLLGILYIVSAIMRYLQAYIMTGVSNKITYNLRRDISQKINRMPLKYFDRVQSGEILSRVTNDVDTVSTNLNQSIVQIITSVTTIIGVVVMMLSINVTMTLIALLSLPLSVVIMKIIIKKSQPYFSARQGYLGNINGHIEEMFSGHLVLKAFNGEADSQKEFDILNNKLYDANRKSQFISGMMMPFMKFIGNLSYVAICIIGSVYMIKGKIGLGDIQAFTQYIHNFTQPVQQVANISNILQSTAAAAERVFDFLEQEEEVLENPNPVENNIVKNEKGESVSALSQIKGKVEFKDVNFGYLENQPIIKDFSVGVKPGQTVAIVGPTGAGKTTIVKLLMRYYDLHSGDIFIDDMNIKDFSRNGLRSLFGMVLQDTWLYNASIADNIRYGNDTATLEDIKNAAKAAQFHHFVKTLPQGYDMILSEEGGSISQGQKQLLTIARAILSNPKILILDEATSSVDTRTEALIQKAMANLQKGRTSFVIAHRLSTIRDADVILVMKDGNIIETGNHEELIAKKGFYADLYQSQFENAEEIA